MDNQIALFVEKHRPELSPLCPDPAEEAVARVLRWGQANARQVSEIARLTDVSGRRVQKILHHILHEHRWPIGTSMDEPFGNYLIDSAEELEHTVSLLRSRGISNLVRAAALKRMTVQEYLKSIQNELDLELRRN